MVSLYGIFKIQGLYLPFLYLFCQVVLGGSPIDGIIGIGCGHVFYLLYDYYPKVNGKYILETPQFLYTFQLTSLELIFLM